MLSVLDGGWSDAAHAYLYADMSAAPRARARDMLRARPVLRTVLHQQWQGP